MSKNRSATIPAIKVHQWLSGWDEVKWNTKEHRRKPEASFYQFSISAPALKTLSGVYPRTTAQRRRGSEDMGIQRRHEAARSKEIANFVKYGYPWSELSKAKRESGEYKDLRKPGWLPTSIVINILRPDDVRRGRKVSAGDLVRIVDDREGRPHVELPKSFNKDWKFSGVPPVEIIDGQHRLWAFEETELNGEFELPVVAFVGLDLSWQAYLFYTINIKPKKINASLAFDLYPLLRTEEWLTKFEGHVIYRETRAQELVDLLWSQSKSPWHKRINMLGEPGFKGRMVSQSAWIRSLLATYIKSWEGRGVRVGGLFGAPVGSHQVALPWSRAEQAAFLIVVGQELRDAVAEYKGTWTSTLRRDTNKSLIDSDNDPAFFGPDTLLNQDQGIRAFLYVTNDLTYMVSDDLKLDAWGGRSEDGETEERLIDASIASLRKSKKILGFIKAVSTTLATYDWRASSAPGLSNEQSLLKAAFRGSGGYKELRKHALRHMLTSDDQQVARAAKQVTKALRYD